MGLLRGHGAPAAARRCQLGGRDCVSVLRVLDPGRLAHGVAFITPPGRTVILHLPLTPLRILLMDGNRFMNKDAWSITEDYYYYYLYQKVLLFRPIMNHLFRN